MRASFIVLILFSHHTWAAKLEVKSCITSPSTTWTEFKTKCGTVFLGKVSCLLPSGLTYFETVVCEKKRNEKEPNPKDCYDEFKDNSKTYVLPSPYKNTSTVLGVHG